MKNIFLVKFALCAALCAVMPAKGMDWLFGNSNQPPVGTTVRSQQPTSSSVDKQKKPVVRVSNGRVEPKIVARTVNSRATKNSNDVQIPNAVKPFASFDCTICSVSAQEAQKNWPEVQWDQERKAIRVVHLKMMEMGSENSLSTKSVQIPYELILKSHNKLDSFLPQKDALADKIGLLVAIAKKIDLEHQEELRQIEKDKQQALEFQKQKMAAESAQAYESLERIATDKVLQVRDNSDTTIDKLRRVLRQELQEKTDENKQLESKNKKLESKNKQLSKQIKNISVQHSAEVDQVNQEKRDNLNVLKENKKRSDSLFADLEESLQGSDQQQLFNTFKKSAAAQRASIVVQRNIAMAAFLACLGSILGYIYGTHAA